MESFETIIFSFKQADKQVKLVKAPKNKLTSWRNREQMSAGVSSLSMSVINLSRQTWRYDSMRSFISSIFFYVYSIDA